jgi:hypothetical protein
MSEIRETDSKGRLTLPRKFANSVLILDVVSDVEIVLRKAKVIPMDSSEELPPLSTLKPLSDADRDLFLAAIDGPPKPPTESMKKALLAAEKTN